MHKGRGNFSGQQAEPEAEMPSEVGCLVLDARTAEDRPDLLPRPAQRAWQFFRAGLIW
jgi:hypothetical protein